MLSAPTTGYPSPFHSWGQQVIQLLVEVFSVLLWFLLLFLLARWVFWCRCRWAA